VVGHPLRAHKVFDWVTMDRGVPLCRTVRAPAEDVTSIRADELE
jgi:hypothetical protein